MSIKRILKSSFKLGNNNQTPYIPISSASRFKIFFRHQMILLSDLIAWLKIFSKPYLQHKLAQISVKYSFECFTVVILFHCCHPDLPTSLQSTLHGLVTASSYVEGVRSTMLVGGCNASRAGYIGACMAAKVKAAYNFIQFPIVLAHY